MDKQTSTPMLFPYEPETFWDMIRAIIREEIKSDGKTTPANPVAEQPGFTQKPLLKIDEVCALFRVSRPTIYDWIKHEKLRPYKVRKRTYFLWNDIQKLIPV